METSLERLRKKIADIEAKLADLRIAERELVALDAVPPPKAAPAPAAKRTLATIAAPAPRQTIGAAIAGVLSQHGALSVAEIADLINATGRDIDKRSVSYALQAMKRQGLVKSGDGKWMLRKARSK